MLSSEYRTLQTQHILTSITLLLLSRLESLKALLLKAYLQQWHMKPFSSLLFSLCLSSFQLPPSLSLLFILPLSVIPRLPVSVPPLFAVFSLLFLSSSFPFPQVLLSFFAPFLPIVPKHRSLSANEHEECSLEV